MQCIGPRLRAAATCSTGLYGGFRRGHAARTIARLAEATPVLLVFGIAGRTNGCASTRLIVYSATTEGWGARVRWHLS